MILALALQTALEGFKVELLREAAPIFAKVQSRASSVASYCQGVKPIR